VNRTESTSEITPERVAVVRRNVRLLTAYNIFADLMPFFAVWVVYLTDFRDLSLAQVGIMEGAFWGIKVIAEMPTGAFADRFGRKLTFIVGAVVEGVGILAFAFAGGFALLLGSYVFWATGIAFRSGNGEAFLYDTLAEVDETNDYARVSGRMAAYAGVASLFGGVVGGVVAGVIDLQAAILIGVLPYGLALAMLLPMDEPRRSDSGGGLGYVQTLTTAVRALRDLPAVRYMILFEVTIATVIVSQFLLLQPFFDSHDVSYAWFGVLMVPMRLGGIAGGYFTSQIHRLLGLRGQLGWTLAICVAGVATVAVIDSLWAFTAFIFVSLAMAAFWPTSRAYINDRTESSIRATVLSFAPFGQSITFAIAAAAAGVVADLELRLAFGVSAASVAVVSGACYLLWLRADAREGAPPDLPRDVPAAGAAPAGGD
jgi:MFS family permease